MEQSSEQKALIRKHGPIGALFLVMAVTLKDAVSRWTGCKYTAMSYGVRGKTDRPVAAIEAIAAKGDWLKLGYTSTENIYIDHLQWTGKLKKGYREVSIIQLTDDPPAPQEQGVPKPKDVNLQDYIVFADFCKDHYFQYPTLWSAIKKKEGYLHGKVTLVLGKVGNTAKNLISHEDAQKVLDYYKGRELEAKASEPKSIPLPATYVPRPACFGDSEKRKPGSCRLCPFYKDCGDDIKTTLDIKTKYPDPVKKPPIGSSESVVKAWNETFIEPREEATRMAEARKAKTPEQEIAEQLQAPLKDLDPKDLEQVKADYIGKLRKPEPEEAPPAPPTINVGPSSPPKPLQETPRSMGYFAPGKVDFPLPVGTAPVAPKPVEVLPPVQFQDQSGDVIKEANELHENFLIVNHALKLRLRQAIKKGVTYTYTKEDLTDLTEIDATVLGPLLLSTVPKLIQQGLNFGIDIIITVNPQERK